MIRTSTIWLTALMCFVPESPVWSQCHGDHDGNGRVTVDELVLSVNDALNGCMATACPQRFDQDTTTASFGCAFLGRWNATCGSADLTASFFGDGEVLVVVFVNPDFFYGGTVTSSTTATLDGYFTEPDGADFVDSPGNLQLTGDGSRLIVDPATAPFAIDQCEFERYDGGFDRTFELGGVAARVDGAGLLKAFRERRGAHLPLRNFPRQ